MNAHIPLARPCPPRLSEALARLQALEESGTFSNFGPLNADFERRMQQEVFGAVGSCLTVCNATMGLVLAIRAAILQAPSPRRRYALMPSFTFAAAAQAALWNGLTPLFCDIDPVTWCADPASELELLKRFGDEIAVVVPCATFGYDIDLAWYKSIHRNYGLPVVVDAAASLGTRAADGSAFGTGSPFLLVFSMHVTKPFSTAEGGLIYSGDQKAIETLRVMSNFGFGEPRNATMLGLNAKLSEIAALLATLQLDGFQTVVQDRARVVNQYQHALPEFSFQATPSNLQAHQFTSVLLPRRLAPYRSKIREQMRASGVDTATYFSPHVADQPHFSSVRRFASLSVTHDIAARILTLPLFDTMTEEEVSRVAEAMRSAIHIVTRRYASHRSPVLPVREAPSAPAIQRATELTSSL